MIFQNNKYMKLFANSLKPLQAIQNLSHLIDQNTDPNEILKKWSDIMLTGFSHPKIFASRIVYRGKEYCSSLFQFHELLLQYPLIIRGENWGNLELYYPAKQTSFEKSLLNISDEIFFDIIGQRLLLYLEQYDLTQQLQMQKTEFQTLVENDPDYVFRMDSRFHILYINPAVVNEIEKINLETPINSLDELLFSKFFLVDLKPMIQQVLKSNQKCSLEHTITINKIKKWFFSHIIPEKTSVEGIMTILIISTDITDQKMAEATLLTAKTIAESANKAKSDFIANISHELRSPLNSIIGFSELLIDEKIGSLTDNQGDAIKTINESAHYLLALINDIIDISKIEAQKSQFSPTQVNVNNIVHRMRLIFQERANSKGLKFTTENYASRDLIIGDEIKLKQIFHNLLSNAIKYTEAGGEIGIITRENGNDLIITVWDTGIGIDPTDYNHLFQPFQRLENPLIKNIPGTGLGLAITKKLIEMHHGKIWVGIHNPKGTEFHFSLPLYLFGQKMP